jgi:hypothetical protein
MGSYSTKHVQAGRTSFVSVCNATSCGGFGKRQEERNKCYLKGGGGADYHHIKIDRKYYPFVELSNLFVCEVSR